MQVDLKRLKPVGVAFILIFSAVSLIMFFTYDFGVPPRYTPMHDISYYQESDEHMEDLLREVYGNVLPDIPGIVGCEIAPGGRTILLTVEKKEIGKVEAVMTRDFGEGLFEYKEYSP